MTIYSGKDAKVYLGTYELPYVNSVSINKGKRRFLAQDYQGNQVRFGTKPLISGTLTVYDAGMPYLSHFINYNTIESAKLVSKFSNERYSLGFQFPDVCTTIPVYNGQPDNIYINIPTAVTPSGITFKDIHVYIDGIGSPNSEIYKIEVIDGGDVSRDFETFPWTTNDPRWVSLSTIDYNTTVAGTWRIKMNTIDAATNSGNCQRIYGITDTNIKYPFFTGSSRTDCVICEMEDWPAKEQKIDVTVEVSTNYTAELTGVVWGTIGKTYTAGEMNTMAVPFTAESLEWKET